MVKNPFLYVLALKECRVSFVSFSSEIPDCLSGSKPALETLFEPFFSCFELFKKPILYFIEITNLIKNINKTSDFYTILLYEHLSFIFLL